ncbi:hypothetical protein MNQ96_00385 [Sphingopyxis granuli]|uniref:hypothetical protein n=1 Tax=Sphingopyxis granuli TaxID=267128 RepID=UPI001F531788|nr:hypothetical protein [Sphingopyxis granuli]UNK79591.1 hypothetical protein MNQ96_00385 [Sphingopyxis granuli]
MTPFSFFSRRGFLGTGAAVAIATGGGYLWLRGDDEEYERMAAGAAPTVLSVKEYAVLNALAAAIIQPPKAGPSVGEAMTALRIDRELSFHHETSLTGDIKASLVLLENMSLLDGLGPRFTGLSEKNKQLFLANCANAGPGLRRAAYNGIRFLIVFFYYTDDRTWPALGYSGPFVDEKPFDGGNRIANLTSAKARHTGASAS